ncbi:hypothetical protein C2S53_008374 [Perilla frutescens var. hirtella]|uniref:F-box domain-containing protein n=1 Tax=Perilla frutescens var. hirtella TaxID=608512 RepID=A0AAD4JDG7_PERFH|nr:hypothetical protein C2S53_008374 [Perilla frutescens var. hirtella]
MIFSSGMASLLVIRSLLMVTLCGSAVFALLRRRRGGGGVSYPDNVSMVVHKDIISQLPDDILVSIIARTPTRFAVSTSILSKRWRNLYKSVSSFTLRCHDLLSPYTRLHDSEGLIIHRVERFLSLCSGFKIRYFDLQLCLAESYTNQFEQCIYSLGKSGVEELTLYFSCCRRPSYTSFSFHLLSKLPSLKHLSLSKCSLQPQPHLNRKCYSLQTLHLTCVTLEPGSLECILSNCLLLHSVTIHLCQCPPKLCIRSPNLKLNTLIITLCIGIREIEFYSSSLITFEFGCQEMARFVFDYVPQLETVCLSNDMNWNNIMSYVVGKLSEDLPHLKSLTFETIGDFDKESTGLMSLGMITFSNLRHLDMSVCCTPRTNLLAFTPFLETCPLLEELHFDARNMEDHAVAVRGKPVVLHHPKLRTVEITGFRGTDYEIEFALYILKSAVALEQMFIIRCVRCYSGFGSWRNMYGVPWTEETRNKIQQRLQGQALSKTAKLMMLHESIFLGSIHHSLT